MTHSNTPAPESPAELTTAGLFLTRHLTRYISKRVADSPARALSPNLVGHQRKPALRIDVNAEDELAARLHDYHSGKFAYIEYFGEESLDDPHLDLTGRSGTFALADAVDGTDLVERGLSNWCTAVVFF